MDETRCDGDSTVPVVRGPVTRSRVSTLRRTFSASCSTKLLSSLHTGLGPLGPPPPPQDFRFRVPSPSRPGSVPSRTSERLSSSQDLRWSLSTDCPRTYDPILLVVSVRHPYISLAPTRHRTWDGTAGVCREFLGSRQAQGCSQVDRPPVRDVFCKHVGLCVSQGLVTPEPGPDSDAHHSGDSPGQRLGPRS